MKNMYEEHGEFVSIIISRKGEYHKTIIDKDDLPKVAVITGTWHLNNRGYISTTRNKKSLSLHRFIMNPPFSKLIDHIDGNPLNNRKSNLRIVDPEANVQNIRDSGKNPSSGLKGVKFDGDRNLWQAQINHQKKTVHLGYYGQKDDAGLAYLIGKALLHNHSVEADIFKKISEKVAKYKID